MRWFECWRRRAELRARLGSLLRSDNFELVLVGIEVALEFVVVWRVVLAQMAWESLQVDRLGHALRLWCFGDPDAVQPALVVWSAVMPVFLVASVEGSFAGLAVELLGSLGLGQLASIGSSFRLSAFSSNSFSLLRGEIAPGEAFAKWAVATESFILEGVQIPTPSVRHGVVFSSGSHRPEEESEGSLECECDWLENRVLRWGRVTLVAKKALVRNHIAFVECRFDVPRQTHLETIVSHARVGAVMVRTLADIDLRRVARFLEDDGIDSPTEASEERQAFEERERRWRGALDGVQQTRGEGESCILHVLLCDLDARDEDGKDRVEVGDIGRAREACPEQ